MIRISPRRTALGVAFALAVPSFVSGDGEILPAAASASYEAELAPGGGLSLRVGGRSLRIETDISYPNAGLNRLVAGPPDRSGQDTWAASMRRTGDGAEVRARGRDYRLRRRVHLTPRKIEVADTLTNLDAHRGLGLLVRHRVAFGGQPNLEVRLAGNPDPALLDSFSNGNPTVHVGLGDVGLGLLCEDDVLRNQARLFRDPVRAEAGLRTEMLWLPPGGSYTLRWSAWPMASADYYDFVNLVREDWGANYAAEGAWTFFDPDSVLALPVERLRADIERLGVRFACSWGGWVDAARDAKRIGFGSDVASPHFASYRDRLRRATRRLHEARPGIQVLIYYNSSRDTHEDAGTRFPDSLLTGAGGHEATDWGGQFSRAWSMAPTAENTFGRAMLDLVDLYMDEIGADGLYWDEMEATAFGVPLITRSLTDGHSCILDPETHTVRAGVGVVALLGESFRLAVVDKVRRKGGTVMGNGPPTTRAMLSARVQRMVEVQHNDVYHYEGDLASPLGFGGIRTDFGNVSRALDQARLLVATSLDQQSEISRHLFPLTPLELHRGYLLGQERIVTTRSGRFGWPAETVRCRLRIFDSSGRLREEKDAVAGPDRLPVELEAGEVAVVERLP